MSFLPYSTSFDSFGDFAGFFPEGDPALDEYVDGGTEVSFADVINTWLWLDVGVARCFGEFEIFLKVLVYLVDRYHSSGAGRLVVYNDGSGEKKYRVTSLFGDNPKARSGEVHVIFDKDNFCAAAFVNK